MARCSGCGRSLHEGLHSCPSCGGTAIPLRVERGLQPLHEPGDLLEGRYHIEKVLGTGASGIVYGVTDELARTRVALKLLWDRTEEGDATLERLRREIKASQRAPHPHLLPIHDLILVESRPALLMEWVEGETLKDRIRREGGLPHREAEAVAASILKALSHLHGLGVLHRDVKSGNVLLGADGSVKLGDFGLAKGEDLGESLTLTGVALGTPGYMAPEVIRGGEASVRSDLYGVGAVLFEMLAGHVPFQGAGSLEVASRQLAEEPPLHLLKSRRVPLWLVQVVGRLLARDPSDRYASAGEALHALKGRSAGLYFPRAWRRRALAAGLAVALGGLGWGLLAWRKGAEDLATVINGKRLEVRDRTGRTVWARDLDKPLCSAHYGRFGPGGSAAVAVSFMPTEEAPTLFASDKSRTWIECFDEKGRPWSRFELSMTDIPFSQRFAVTLDSHVFRKGEPACLVARGVHATWYPSVLSVFRVQRGSQRDYASVSLLSSVENSGHISRWTYADLEGDGVDEVVYACVNNRLFRALFVGAAPLRGEMGWEAQWTSPDHSGDPRALPLFYRCVGFDAYDRMTFGAPEPRGVPLFVDPQRQIRGLLSPAGDLVLGGDAAFPPPRQVSAFNGLIFRLVQHRDGGRWADMLNLCEGEWPEDTPGPYGYLGRLFRATALLGLGRHGEAASLAEAPPPPGYSGPKPQYLDQIRADARFLSGEYRACMEVVVEAQAASRYSRTEVAQTGLWAALCAGDEVWGRRLTEGDPIRVYPWYADLYPGIAAYLRGDFEEAERRFRLSYASDAGSKVTEPGLWLTDALLRRGRTAEARGTFDRLAKAFPGEHLEGGEVGLFLRFREGAPPGLLVPAFDGLLARRRLEAATEPEARALLPLTLARAAAVHRAAGDIASARRLETEARRLAPPSWKAALKMPGD